jgi:hypothetical protein
MPRKRPSKTSEATRHGHGEFRFKIEAYTPETMPFPRLVEYLRELAILLGEKDVHLVGIEEGSTVPVLHVAYESIPKVQVRAAAVGRGDAPRDPLIAYRRINEMLRQDNARAVFERRDRGKRGAKILEFPGKDEVQESFATVKQFGTLDGRVIRVGGIGADIPIILQSEDKEIAGCYTNRQLAKELGKVLFEPVRVVGVGTWCRNTEGVWGLVRFRIDSFERLDDVSLSNALTKLRSIEVEWGDEAYDELGALRRGRANGGA